MNLHKTFIRRAFQLSLTSKETRLELIENRLHALKHQQVG